MTSGYKTETEPSRTPAVALTIAGFDPSSGAGITADLKVFAAHHVYGVAAATALTVQSTIGVSRVEPVSSMLLKETLACLAEDLRLTGIKIGMLATQGNVAAVADFLEGLPGKLPVVLDPVLRSSSGHPLLDEPALECFRARLLPLVGCITPNLAELLLLGSTAARQPEKNNVVLAAALLAEQYPRLAIVATGGHLAAPDDYVLEPGGTGAWLPGQWVETPATHGTGCGHSSALLCGLIAGLPLLEAARHAKRYVAEALLAATPIGHGGGSMHHLYALAPTPGAAGSSYPMSSSPSRKEP